MATISRDPSRRLLMMLQMGWYAGLVAAAFAMLVINGDPAAALVLAIVLPVALLRSPGKGMITTLCLASGLAVMGLYMSRQTGSDPAFRSMFLSVGMLAPALGIAIALPMGIRWMQQRNSLTDESSGDLIETVDQSSMMFMSDSTVCGTLGKVTSETNRSKAA